MSDELIESVAPFVTVAILAACWGMGVVINLCGPALTRVTEQMRLNVVVSGEVGLEEPLLSHLARSESEAA